MEKSCSLCRLVRFRWKACIKSIAYKNGRGGLIGIRYIAGLPRIFINYPHQATPKARSLWCSAMFWKGRAMPSAAIREGRVRVMPIPSIAIRPESGKPKPLMLFSRHVFAAPFGPMIEIISLSPKEGETSVLAWILPNRLETLETTKP